MTQGRAQRGSSRIARSSAAFASAQPAALGLEPAERRVIGRRHPENRSAPARTRPAHGRAPRRLHPAVRRSPNARSASAARARTTRDGSISRAVEGRQHALAVAGGQQRVHGLRAHHRLGIGCRADERVELIGRQRDRLGPATRLGSRWLRPGVRPDERRLALHGRCSRCLPCRARTAR